MALPVPVSIDTSIVRPANPPTFSIPRELIEVRAYERFEARGRAHGDDWADWFGAERDLEQIFASVDWFVAVESPNCLTLRAKGPTHAIRELSRYFEQRPAATATLDGSTIQGRSLPFGVFWPDEPGDGPGFERKTTVMHDTKPLDPGNVRSPVSFLSREEFAGLKGQLVALLFDGPDKGTVIAKAPLDFEHPERPRLAIREQVEKSSYRGRRYQLRSIPAEPLGG